MDFKTIEQSAASLRARALSTNDVSTLELIESIEETLAGLTKPQRADRRILRDMASWLQKITSSLAA